MSCTQTDSRQWEVGNTRSDSYLGPEVERLARDGQHDALLRVQTAARRGDVDATHVGRLQRPADAVRAVVRQAHVVHVLLTERRVVHDLLVWLCDDVTGGLGRHAGADRNEAGEETRDKRHKHKRWNAQELMSFMLF